MSSQLRSGLRSMSRELIKAAAFVDSARGRSEPRDVVFLMYHRVTGDTGLELDLPWDTFQAQMELLAAGGRVRSLDDALALLASPSPRPRDPEPWYVLTFDDAYEDFFTAAFPLLSRLGLPSTLYVPTGFIDDPKALPLTSPPDDHFVALRPCTWDMLRSLHGSPLVTLGSHTHSHRELPSLSDDEVVREIELALERFGDELGFRPVHFAYPRGAWDERCERIVGRYHRSMALIEGGTAVATGFSPGRIPRMGIGRSDGMRWFRPKLRGRLDSEERLKAQLKGVGKEKGRGYAR